MEHYVSPKFMESKLASGNLVDKIDVFEDQWRGWVLDHANGLLAATYSGSAHSGLAVLIIISTYFEAIECFISGQDSDKKSSDFFCQGFRKVFQRDPGADVQEVAEAIYHEIRCGLFHEVMVVGRVIIAPYLNNAFECGIKNETRQVTSISVNPRLVVWAVNEHFDCLVKRLRDPGEKELRKNFEVFWDIRPLQKKDRPTARCS